MVRVTRTCTPGIYHLLLHLPKLAHIRVGRLGVCTFPRGWYVYTGSAMNGLEARVARHRRRRKKGHWHSDYLLRHAEIVEVVTVRTRRRIECARSRRVLSLPGAQVVVKGFGASDCRCEAHLVHFPERPNL